MVDEYGFDWTKHKEEQKYWAELRHALWLGIQEHNARVEAEQTPEPVEKRKRGRPKGSKNKGG